MLDITPATFDAEVLKSDAPVLLEFWAPWCGPCHTMKPILKELDETEKTRLKVALVNAQDHPELANQYSVLAIPTFFVFKGGQVVAQHIGAVNKQQLRKLAELE